MCFMYFEFMVYLPGDLILSAAHNTFCLQVYVVMLMLLDELFSPVLLVFFSFIFNRMDIYLFIYLHDV